MLHPYPYLHPGISKGYTRTPGIVPQAYRSYKSSGYGYECRTSTEPSEVPVRVIPGKIQRVWFRTYPAEHSLVSHSFTEEQISSQNATRTLHGCYAGCPVDL